MDLSEDQASAVDALARRLGISRGELIHRAVRAYADAHPELPSDEAFGLRAPVGEDGVEYQQRLRAEWER